MFYSESRRSSLVEIKEESEDENSYEEDQSNDDSTTGFEIALDMDAMQETDAHQGVAQVTPGTTINATDDAENLANNITNTKSEHKKSFKKPKSILKRSRRCSTP